VAQNILIMSRLCHIALQKKKRFNNFTLLH